VCLLTRLGGKAGKAGYVRGHGYQVIREKLH
jgi:hypothetical protein